MTSEERKKRPLFEGLFTYFPDALEYIAYVSYVSNEKHNPGEPLHWSKEKSPDHKDAGLRHIKDSVSEVIDPEDGLRHDGKAAWRFLANLQINLEREKKK